MLGLLSLASVIAGAALAYGTRRFPSHVEALETCAGTCLLLGFGLLGSALQDAFYLTAAVRL